MTNAWTLLQTFWADYSEPVIIGTGATTTLLLAFLLYRFLRTANRSKVVSTIAAVVVMAWTSEGLLAVALRKVGLPVPFAAMTFFVFEAMMVAAGLKAEENRKTKGTPGRPGGYVFLIAVVSGGIAAFGARTVAEVVLRLILPLLAVGLWWILLTAERDDDLPEWKARREADRARRAANREATWTVTPRTVLVRLGLMKPGSVTVTEAQRQYRVARMVAFGCTIYRGGRRSPLAWWARRRLFRVARYADAAMIKEARRQVRRSVRAEQLIVPAGPVVELPAEVDPELPVTSSAPDVAEVPPPAPPVVPAEVPGAGSGGSSAPDTPEVPVAPQPGTSGGTSAPKRTGTSAGSRAGSSTRKPAKVPAGSSATKRTAEETRRLIADYRSVRPEATQAEIAKAVGITDRRVRDLSKPTNGHRPDIDLAGVTS